MAWNGSYPTSAAAMATAVGYGTWSSGWLCNEAAGNLAGAFGSPTLTASGLTYSVAGPLGGADTAVSTSAFGGAHAGDTSDVTAATDMILFMVVKLGSGSGYLAKKYDSLGWFLFYDSLGGGSLQFTVYDGVDFVSATVVTIPQGEWLIIGIVVDRGAGINALAYVRETGVHSSNSQNMSAVGDMSNSANFFPLGADAGDGPPGTFAAVYHALGSGIASGLGNTTTLGAALTNFRTQLKGAASGFNNLLLLGCG